MGTSNGEKMKLLKKFKNFFKHSKYAVLEYYVCGEERYIAIYKYEGKWKAIETEAPDIVNDLLTVDDISEYKRKIYLKENYLWSLWDSSSSNEVSEYAKKYCTLKKKQDAYELIELHKEMIKFKKKYKNYSNNHRLCRLTSSMRYDTV